jgi:tRNA pseudouridine synthase 10
MRIPVSAYLAFLLQARLELFVEVSHDETREEFKQFWPDMIDDGGKADLSDDEDKNEQQQSNKKRKRGNDTETTTLVPNPGSLATVKAKLKEMKREDLLLVAPEFPQPSKSIPAYEIKFNHLPIHIAGRYIKLSRNYSQTPWVIMGTDQRIGSGSVQEVITAVLEPAFKADEVKFSSAGREDRDVRMLGRGRPFLLEFINPRKSRFGRAQYADFQKAINSSHPDAVQVRDLQFVPPHASTVIKTSQDTKLKDYQCVIWSQDPLTPERVEAALGKVGVLTLQQYTPVRVLHRRALAMRERKIHKLTYKFIDEHHLTLDMVTQAGTYVKEFVHGDLGRTRPSIRELLNVSAADLLALDVTDVQVDFPTVIDASFDPASSASSIMLDLPKPGERTVIITDEDAE